MREIKGYEGLYHFDDELRIVNTKSGMIKKTQLSSCKYLVVDLYNSGKRKTLLLHRLIAETFLPNPMGFTEVNHKDGNRLNNSISNLEWCDRSYNIQHSYDNLHRKEKIKWKKGGENANSKAVICSDKNGNIIRQFDSIMDVERETGISNSAIVNCLHGRSKTSGGFIWKYVQ